MNDAIQSPPAGLAPAMALALSANFGSVAQWRESFLALAQGHADRGGRLDLVFAPRAGTLRNRWRATASDADATTLLALPLPADAPAFVDAIDWPLAYERYQHAVHAASVPFAAAHADLAGALVLDVRRAGVFAAASTMLPGAAWRDPVAVAEWSAQLPADREVIVYCVYGHEVGRATAMRLRARGLNARYLEGGIDAWQRDGQPTVPKGEAS